MTFTRRGLLKGAVAALGTFVVTTPSIAGKPLLWTPEHELVVSEPELVIATEQPVQRGQFALRATITDMRMTTDVAEMPRSFHDPSPYRQWMPLQTEMTMRVHLPITWHEGFYPGADVDVYVASRA